MVYIWFKNRTSASSNCSTILMIICFSFSQLICTYPPVFFLSNARSEIPWFDITTFQKIFQGIYEHLFFLFFLILYIYSWKWKIWREVRDLSQMWDTYLYGESKRSEIWIFRPLASSSRVSALGEVSLFIILWIEDFEIPVRNDTWRIVKFLLSIILSNSIFIIILF